MRVLGPEREGAEPSGRKGKRPSPQVQSKQRETGCARGCRSKSPVMKSGPTDSTFQRVSMDVHPHLSAFHYSSAQMSDLPPPDPGAQWRRGGGAQ